RYGAGVKGKINLAMSYGLPVVATSTSIEGMHLSSGEDVLTADTPTEFADAIVRLYHDRELWEKLAAGGRENIRRYFSRDVARSAITRLIALADGQIATLREPVRQRVDERRLQQAALVMPFFRPWIGEEDVNRRERRWRDHRVHDLDGVVADHAHVRETERLDAVQQRADARQMDIDGDEIDVALRIGDRGGRFAHAESNLEHERRNPSKDARPIDRRRRERHAVARKQIIAG